MQKLRRKNYEKKAGADNFFLITKFCRFVLRRGKNKNTNHS